MTGITENLQLLRASVARAALAANRTPDSVTMVAVSKAQAPGRIAEAQAAGLRDFGENYLQEALPKVAAFPDLTWHFIGALQSNKTRAVAEHFQWVHTVSSVRIAERLSTQRPYYAGDLQVCIQLLPPEAAGQRSGADPAELAALAAAIRALPRLRLRGLMYMPAAGLAPENLRAQFAEARARLETLRQSYADLDTLSMGMTDDYREAIAAGSTLIRIGSALFGPRT